MIKSIEEAEIIPGTIVLVRADWNVPVKDGKVLDDSRILASKKTIDFILNKGGKVIVISHLGDGDDSLDFVTDEARKIFKDVNINFVKDPWNSYSSDGKKSVDHLKTGEIAVFENIRFWMEKENDEDFAKSLAQFGDIYVNEAFSDSHRKHTSIVSLPSLLPHFAGFDFLEEYKKLSEMLHPKSPFLLILGGVKFETKLPILERFLCVADDIFVGGPMATEASLMPQFQNEKVTFPKQAFTDLDINEETLSILSEKIENAETILWNGPLGNYENGHEKGTVDVAKKILESKARVVIGGGDTLAVIKSSHLIKKFENESDRIFISSAGGAMLDFLASGTLPGIEALNTN